MNPFAFHPSFPPQSHTIILIILPLIKHPRVIIKMIHHQRPILICIGLLDHAPHFKGLRFCHRVIYDVTSNKDDTFVEQELGEECEDDVWGGVGAWALEVLEVGAELSYKKSITKQSFCHWVNTLKCPLPRWTGSKNIGAGAALHYYFKILLPLYQQIPILINNRSSVSNPWRMILFPNVPDLVGWLSLDHRHLHDLSQLSRAWVGEREGIEEFLCKHFGSACIRWVNKKNGINLWMDGFIGF